LIPQHEDWDEEDWRAFSAESKINIRFTTATKSMSEELQAVTSLLVLRNGRPDKASPHPPMWRRDSSEPHCACVHA
jgi:hypothetical protein